VSETGSPRDRVVMYADGGSRGNPGPAGYGSVVLTPDGTVLAERAASLGRVTNNVAEYSGLIAGLEAARELGASWVDVRMDSKLVVEQMSGRWQVKHPDMKPLARKASELVRDFDRVTFEWVPRAENTHADRLANEAMDAAKEGRTWVWAATVRPTVNCTPTPKTHLPGPTRETRLAKPPSRLSSRSRGPPFVTENRTALLHSIPMAPPIPPRRPRTLPPRCPSSAQGRRRSCWSGTARRPGVPRPGSPAGRTCR